MKLHMVWLGPGEDAAAVARVRAASPADEVIVWRSAEILPAVWRPAWDRVAGDYRVQSDLLRLAALRLHGGLYVDWDHTLRADAATITAGWQTLTVVAAGRGGMLPGGLVFCPAGWPHWGLVDEYLERVARQDRAGYLAFTHDLYWSLPREVFEVVRDPGRFPIVPAQVTDRAEVIRFPLPAEPGLGELVAAGLAAVGITPERVSRVLGRPCGCEERKRRLTAFGHRLGIGRPPAESGATR